MTKEKYILVPNIKIRGKILKRKKKMLEEFYYKNIHLVIVYATRHNPEAKRNKDKYTDNFFNFIVIEYTTGLSLTHSYDTREVAKTLAIENIVHIGIEKTKNLIKSKKKINFEE